MGRKRNKLDAPKTVACHRSPSVDEVRGNPSTPIKLSRMAIQLVFAPLTTPFTNEIMRAPHPR